MNEPPGRVRTGRGRPIRASNGARRGSRRGDALGHRTRSVVASGQGGRPLAPLADRLRATGSSRKSLESKKKTTTHHPSPTYCAPTPTRPRTRGRRNRLAQSVCARGRWATAPRRAEEARMSPLVASMADAAYAQELWDRRGYAHGACIRTPVSSGLRVFGLRPKPLPHAAGRSTVCAAAHTVNRLGTPGEAGPGHYRGNSHQGRQSLFRAGGTGTPPRPRRRPVCRRGPRVAPWRGLGGRTRQGPTWAAEGGATARSSSRRTP